MLYATSKASSNSKWMPWELGYFDGLKSDKIRILPIVESSNDDFRGVEYLGLYPAVEMIDFRGIGTRLGRSLDGDHGVRLITEYVNSA
jgi:hypothetical protein